MTSSIVARIALVALCAISADALHVTPTRLRLAPSPKARASIPTAWAGEDKFLKFSAENIPSGMSPTVFGIGASFLFISGSGVVVAGVLEKIAPGTLPPINAITDISNAAMMDAVRTGQVSKMSATFWAQGYFLDVLQQYFASKLPAPEFIAQWCNIDGHYDLCLSAKSMAQEASASLARPPMER